MKKLLVLLLIAMFIVSVVVIGIGCKEEAVSDVEQAEETVEEETPAVEEAEEEAVEEADVVNLVIESWRTDDLSAWQDQILPAFMAEYPNIKIRFEFWNLR